MLALTLLSMLSFAGPAAAARIVAMTDDGTSLIAVDSSNPSVLVPPPGRTTAAAVPISGIPSDEAIVGIDFRTRDGALFAVTKRESAQAIAFLHRINIASGQASQVGGDLDFPEDVLGGMDFISPDSIEAGFRTSTQDHFLFNSETGAPNLLTPFDYPASATDPRVSGLAHDPVSGTLFALDDNLNLLSSVGGGPPPFPSFSGQLTPVGPTGVDLTGSTGFDISASGTGFVSATTPIIFISRLYTIDLAAGTVTGGAQIGSSSLTKFPAIAVVPSGRLSISDVTVTEDAGAAVVRVERRGGSAGAVSATLATADESALAAADYNAVSQPVDFANGETSRTVAVPIVNDSAPEARETLRVTLGSATRGAELEDGDGTVTIADDDPVPPGSPPPAADDTPPEVALAGVPRKLRLRRFLRGFAVRVTPSEAAALEIELRARTRRAQVSRALSSGLAHRSLPVQAAQTFNLILARRALPLAAGARRVRLRPARRLVGRPRRFRAELVVTATDAAGNRRVVRRQIAVRR